MADLFRSTEANAAYFARRAAEERERAERASDTAAKRAHEAMAEGYAARVNKAENATAH